MLKLELVVEPQTGRLSSGDLRLCCVLIIDSRVERERNKRYESKRDQCVTHIVAHFECTLHILVHSVVVERHEECVDDDAQCDEKLDERIVDEEAD